MAIHTPFPQERPGKRLVYHIVTAHASFNIHKSGRDVARDQLELTHDVRVRHAWEEGPADQMGHSVLFCEAADLRNALLGPADDEAVGHESIQVRRDGGVDERVAPATGVLLSIRDH